MSQPRQTPDPRRWRALAVCLSVGFLTMLDVSIVNVALPSIERSLNAGATELQLVIAGYTLAVGLVLVPAGRLGDVRGRRSMFVLGVALFGVTSLAAGAAQTDSQLSVARLLQGAAAGILNPQVSGLIQQMFSGLERGKAFGIFGAVIGVATAIGPLAGGVIIALAGPDQGWRWVFWLNVPIAAAVIPLALRLLPRGGESGGQRRLDIVGIVLIGLGTMAFMVPFVLSGGEGGPGAGNGRWWWAAGAVALGPAVAWWERRYHRRHNAAVLDPALARNTGFLFGAALGLAYFAGFTSIFLVVTLVLQNGLGFSPLMAGLIGMPYALGSAITAQRSGRWVGRWGRWTVVAGLAVAAAGLAAIDVVLRVVPVAHLGWAVAAAMLVAGAGSGAVISPNQTLTFAEVPVHMGGVAGGVLQVGQRIGSAVGVSAVLAGYFTFQASGGPRWAAAQSLLLSIALVLAALAIGVTDARRRGQRRDSPSRDGLRMP